MTLAFWTASAMVMLSFGFALGWAARWAIVDLDQADTIEIDRRQAEEAIELAMRRHLPIKFPDTDPYHPGEVMCLCIGPDGPTDALIFGGPVYHRRHVAAVAVQMLAGPVDDECEATIIDFPERPGA